MNEWLLSFIGTIVPTIAYVVSVQFLSKHSICPFQKTLKTEL